MSLWLDLQCFMNDLLAKMLQRGLISNQAAQQTQAIVAQGVSVDEALFKASGLAEEEILRFLSAELGVPLVDVEQNPPSREFVSTFPARILITHSLLPLSVRDGTVTVASSKLFDSAGLDELRLLCGKDVHAVLAPSAEIHRCLTNLLGVGADTLQSLVNESVDAGVEVVDQENSEDVDLSEAAEDASIIKFVNQVLSEAIELPRDRRAFRALRVLAPRALPRGRRAAGGQHPAGGAAVPAGDRLAPEDPQRTWTSPKNACRRTAGSSSRSPGARWTCACR